MAAPQPVCKILGKRRPFALPRCEARCAMKVWSRRVAPARRPTQAIASDQCRLLLPAPCLPDEWYTHQARCGFNCYCCWKWAPSGGQSARDVHAVRQDGDTALYSGRSPFEQKTAPTGEDARHLAPSFCSLGLSIIAECV